MVSSVSGRGLTPPTYIRVRHPPTYIRVGESGNAPFNKIVGEWVLDGEGNLVAVPRDENHTMPELYEYRMLYNALAFKHLPPEIPVMKSWRHSAGELCFGGGWFIVLAVLPNGQVSNHYSEEHWDLFDIPEVEFPPAYDGHSPEEAADRLRAFLLRGRQ